jgi:hypothetical protein
MFLTCLGCSGQKHTLIPDHSAPHNTVNRYQLLNIQIRSSTALQIFAASRQRDLLESKAPSTLLKFIDKTLRKALFPGLTGLRMIK